MTWAMPPLRVVTATAPPARHTQSAEWAPITSTRLGTGQPPRVLDGHGADLLVGEAGLQEAVGHQGQAILDRRVGALPEIRAPDGVAGTHGAGRGEDLVPRALAGVGRGEGALHQR